MAPQSSISLGAHITFSIPDPDRITIQSGRPSLPRLGVGRRRLLWLGGVCDGPRSSYTVEAHFERLTGAGPAVVTVRPPRASLPLLRLHSQWVDGVFHAFPSGVRKRFVISRAPPTPAVPWEGRDAVLQGKDVFWHSLRGLARCWRYATTTREELVLPASQILRALYLFGPGLAPAVLAGGPPRMPSPGTPPMPAPVSPDLLPSGRGTGWTCGGAFQYEETSAGWC